MPSALRRFLPAVLSSALPACFSVCFSAGLVACAADALPPPPKAERRVMVKLVRANVDAEAIAQRAGRASGVPVRYLASVSPLWHGLGLACADEALCDAAVQALRADTAFFEAVERDERRRLHPSTPT